MIESLAVNRMAFRADDVFASMTDENANTGVFLLLYLSILCEKFIIMAKVTKSIPRYVNYMSHDVQNKLIKIKSSILTLSERSTHFQTHWLPRVDYLSPVLNHVVRIT